jgi:hypothetical protein
MKLTDEQKSVIRAELFKNVKNDETRSKIISASFGFAHENGEDGDIEKMVSYLMNNQDEIDELFMEFGMSMPYLSETDTEKKTTKK